MINQIKSIITNPLFSGSAVMIIGSNFGNALAYLYHVVIGRLLGPSNYGELSAVLSLLGLLFTSFNFLGLVIVKFISSAKKEEIPSIFKWFTKKIYIAGFIFGVLLILLSASISNFLHIHLNIALLIPVIVFFAVLSFVYRSLAQGLMKFWSIVISLNLDLISRLAIGVILISMGYSVFGAVTGILVSTLLTFFYLRWTTTNETSVHKKVKVEIKSDVVKYAVPILFATLATNSMFSTDVILVKHYFNAHDAGIYASLSTLGRIIFYGTGPVAAVMFPMIAKRYSEGKNSNTIFYLSLFLTIAISGAVLLLYYLLPELSIKILFGDKYLEAAKYLFPFGIFMSLFAAGSLIFNYFLSIEKTSVVYISIIASTAQILGIVIWHSNFYQVIQVSIYSSLFFLIALLIYYRYYTGSEKVAPQS